MYKQIRNVIVALSGGVDSAVVALLLKRKGYNVQAVFMQNWDIADEKGHCLADEDYKDAVIVCNKLDIKLHRVNFVKQYWNEVFCELIKDYQNGFTPNPDVLCNRNIKFNYFYDYAMNRLNADAIATGHYARTSFGPYLERYNAHDDVRLFCAKDLKKDQTLFLSQVEQRALRRTMFPLGDLVKSEVKQIAKASGLEKVASKKESMGICFIGVRNFQDFIKEYIDDKPGDFVNVDDGKVVGQHNGLHQWTLGQRTKISGLSTAFFTARKDVEKNIIYVTKGTDHPLLYTHIVFTSVPHWIHSQPPELRDGNIFECQFKFQHVETWTNCQVYQSDDSKRNGGLVIRLSERRRAITPGQYAVLSKNDECLGSAKILNDGISDFTLDYFQGKYNQSTAQQDDSDKCDKIAATTN